MTARRVYLLVVLALIVIAAALWLSSQRHLPRDIDVGSKILPQLKAGDILEIDLVRAGVRRVVTLEVRNHEWTIAERDHYPADAARVRGLVLGLADLKIVEEKTSDPKNYPAIGVEDIAGSSAGGTQIELQGSGPVASLILGRSSGGKASFVRKPGSAQSLLASPQVLADPDPKNWLQRPIIDVAAERMQAAHVSLGKIAYVLSRKDRAHGSFTLALAPKGKVLASDTAGDVIGAALTGLELEDVKAFDAAQWKSAADHAEFRTFDGWVVSVDGLAEGDKRWIHLASRYDEALAKSFPAPAADPKAAPVDHGKDAAALGTRVAPWAFEVPKYKYDTLFKPLEEIVKKP